MAIQKLKGAPRSFSATIASAAMQSSIRNTLRDPARADRFTANLITMVSHTPKLAECDPKTVVSAALLGETLNLNPAPALGQFYVVPFKTTATFILGYRGLIQLAIRSGEFRRFNALAIKAGEYVSWNPLTEEFKADIIEEEEEREKRPTIGFYAMFETLNGFRKETYWSKDRVYAYAEHFSPKNFNRKNLQQFEKDAATMDAEALPRKWGPWYVHFDTMACKTLIRSLLKFAPMSPDLQSAAAHDERAVVQTGDGAFDSLDVDGETGIGGSASGAGDSAPAALSAPEEKPTIDLAAAENPREKAVAPTPPEAQVPTNDPSDEIF